jgi:hypothetical protein
MKRLFEVELSAQWLGGDDGHDDQTLNVVATDADKAIEVAKKSVLAKKWGRGDVDPEIPSIKAGARLYKSARLISVRNVARVDI